MRTVDKNDNGTRGRLLKAACEVFAAKGYHDATVAEICRRAGANVAAVNYHFSSKAVLYVEAWRQAFKRSLETYPADGGVPADAPAAQRLRGRILAIMRRFADPETHEFEIIHKEFANPTGLLKDVMRSSIEPLQRQLADIVRRLLGKAASDRQVMLCQMSIRAQCFDVMMRHRHHKKFARVGMKAELPREDLEIEAIADHITRFSLAGIREIRRRLETDELAATGSAPSNRNKKNFSAVL